MSENKIAIVTDSSAHIPESALEGLDIITIPLWLIWDEQRYRDSLDIDSPTFYQRLKSSKTLPSSSQPTPGEFIELFQKLSDKFEHIVVPIVSSAISGTYASAVLAQQALPELDIRVIDTLQSAMGCGIISLCAARAAAVGKSVEEVVATVKETCEKTYMMFVVDTLEYLHRGGRIGGAKRLLGSALKIKPLLHFHEGTIQPLASIRTKAKAVATLLDMIEEKIKGTRIVEAAVMDIDVPDEGDSLAERLKARFIIPVVHRGGVSPVVGTHVGPGALGVAFSLE
ncbi:MAG: DegV family protein [Anaerolineae bacterium]|nr:DegV family protein [Anaerolineae bacterium]